MDTYATYDMAFHQEGDFTLLDTAVYAAIVELLLELEGVDPEPDFRLLGPILEGPMAHCGERGLHASIQSSLWRTHHDQSAQRRRQGENQDRLHRRQAKQKGLLVAPSTIRGTPRRGSPRRDRRPEGLAQGSVITRRQEMWIVWAMLAMLGLVVCGCPGVARDESRAHLGRGSALSRALRVRGVGHGPIVRRGGGGGRGGGERRALHDPISLLIVDGT